MNTFDGEKTYCQEDKSKVENKSKVESKKAASAKNKNKDDIIIRKTKEEKERDKQEEKERKEKETERKEKEKQKQAENKKNCPCANCNTLETKHNSTCCFAPDKPYSTDLYGGANANGKRCNNVMCRLGEFEVWNNIDEKTVRELLVKYPVCLTDCPSRNDGRIVEGMKKLARLYPSYPLDDLMIPNWVARNTTIKGLMVYKMMSAGFQYRVGDSEFIKVIIDSFKPKVGIIICQTVPKNWTKEFEEDDRLLSYKLAKEVYKKESGHYPYIQQLED